MSEIHEHVPQTETREAVIRDDDERPVPSDVGLIEEETRHDLTADWQSIQAAFVDDPREAVARAEELVDRCMRELSEAFTRRRATLEESWSKGENVSTEDLRMALQRYRAFFQRFLSI